MLHRFVKNEWRVLSSQTIGVEFASKIIKVGTGARRKRIKLQVSTNTASMKDVGGKVNNVVLALGYGWYRTIPIRFTFILSRSCWSHSCIRHFIPWFLSRLATVSKRRPSVSFTEPKRYAGWKQTRSRYRSSRRQQHTSGNAEQRGLQLDNYRRRHTKLLLNHKYPRHNERARPFRLRQRSGATKSNLCAGWPRNFYGRGQSLGQHSGYLCCYRG